MSKELNALLEAFAKAPGETVEEKAESLLAAGDIFSPNPEVVRGWARGVDSISMTWQQVVRMGGLDVQAAALSRRLRAIAMDISPQQVRAQPDFWSSRAVEGYEDLHRRRTEMRPHRRKRRIAA